MVGFSEFKSGDEAELGSGGVLKAGETLKRFAGKHSNRLGKR